MDLPLRKSRFLDEIQIFSYKSVQSTQCALKYPLRDLLGLPKDQGQRNSSEKLNSG